MNSRNFRLLLTLLAIGIVLVVTPASFADDVITIGEQRPMVGNTVEVPIYVRDVSGTVLGRDQVAGSRIQSFSIKVNFSPSSAIASTSFSRAGITAGLSPKIELDPSDSGSSSLLATFAESSNLIPFTLNSADPRGDLVAKLVFTFSSSVQPGQQIALSLDPELTQLTNEGGTIKESIGAGDLSLVNNDLVVPVPTLSITPALPTIELHGGANMTVQLSAPVPNPLTVNLSSSHPDRVSIPSSIVIPGGAASGSFRASAFELGVVTITASLPQEAGGSRTTSNVEVIGPSFELNPTEATVSAGGRARMSAFISTAQPAEFFLTLTSSDPTVVAVPATLRVGAAVNDIFFEVDGLAPGKSTLTVTAPESLGGGTATARVTVTLDCTLPAVPQPSAPAEIQSESSYDIVWTAVSGATEYSIDESKDSAFTSVVTKNVSIPRATFIHSASEDTRYYYRVRSHNRAGACDVSSAASSTVSVLVRRGRLSRILPVVGSVPGGFGSYFKTSIQLYNPTNTAVSGKIVYHPSGVPGKADDPSVPYSLGPGRTVAFEDFLLFLNLTGLGSADLVGDVGSALPLALIRIYNDAGVAGTAGMTVDPIRREQALQTGETAALMGPVDINRFRLNIGVRTLEQGASMVITVRDRDGKTVKVINASYEPTFFAQLPSPAVLEGYELMGGETISFTVTRGAAIIYGSTTDKTTNDPSLQFSQRL